MFVGIHCGRTCSGVEYCLERPTYDQRDGTVPPPPELNKVQFDPGSCVKTQLAWCKDTEQWIWGRDVDKLVNSGGTPIQMELFLESSDVAQSVREYVKSQLDELPPLARQHLGLETTSWPQSLVFCYLKLLWQDAKKRISDTGLKLEEFDILCWLRVPKCVVPRFTCKHEH